MQVCELRELSIKLIEKCMFGYVWLGSRSDKERGADRIKRSVLKNDYGEGGLNITDVESLNKALNFRQFIRASKSSHLISKIQRFCLEELGYIGNLKMC